MINTVFPIYEATAYQLQRRDYYSSSPSRLYCPNNKLLPFQVALPTMFTGSIAAYNIMRASDDSLVENLLPHIESADVVTNDFSTSVGRKYFQYLGSMAFKSSHTLADGNYYLRLTTGVGTYYSEVFTVCSTLLSKGDKVRIEFSNARDVDDIEPICYQNGWKQIVYLDGDLKGSGHTTVKEVDERDGYELPRSVTVYETYRLRTYLSETMYRGLIRLPVHSSVKVYGRDSVERVVSRVNLTDPVWSGGGAWCRCTIEFMVESATSKNTNLNLT